MDKVTDINDRKKKDAEGKQRPLLRARVPKQKAAKYRLLAHLQNKDISDLMEEAWDDLLKKHKFDEKLVL